MGRRGILADVPLLLEAVAVCKRSVLSQMCAGWRRVVSSGLAGLVVCVAATGISRDAMAQSAPGEVRWFGLFTTDAAAAGRFYAELLGWELHESAPGRYLVSHDGELIAGITEIERRDDSTWLTGVVVTDLEASLRAARRLGGQVLVDASRADGLASWAVIEDPEGAQIMLIVPERVFGGTARSGNWVWSELWTHDPADATRFYAEVVGWERADVGSGDGGTYPTFQSSGLVRAGLVPIQTGDMEPGWAPYLGVDDLASAITRARALGGQVLLEPVQEIHGGHVAVLSDPTGVSFLMVELEEDTP